MSEVLDPDKSGASQQDAAGQGQVRHGGQEVGVVGDEGQAAVVIAYLQQGTSAVDDEARFGGTRDAGGGRHGRPFSWVVRVGSPPSRTWQLSRVTNPMSVVVTAARRGRLLTPGAAFSCRAFLQLADAGRHQAFEKYSLAVAGPMVVPVVEASRQVPAALAE